MKDRNTIKNIERQRRKSEETQGVYAEGRKRREKGQKYSGFACSFELHYLQTRHK